MTAGRHPLRSRDLETTAVLAVVLLLLYLPTGRQPLLYGALALLGCGLFLKPVAAVIARCWLRFAEILGRFNAGILLSLVYMLILTPIALLYRCFTKNPLQLKREPGGASYFRERNHTYGPKDMEKMW